MNSDEGLYQETGMSRKQLKDFVRNEIAEYLEERYKQYEEGEKILDELLGETRRDGKSDG